MKNKKPIYRLGCNPDPKKRTAYRLLKPLTVKQVKALPAAYSIPAAANVPVYDQGDLGSCISFGSGNAFEIRQNQVDGTSFTVCHMQIYQCALVHDNEPRNEDIGSSLSTAAWVLENQGAAPESEYAYDVTKFGQPIPQKVMTDALKDKLLKAVKLDATDLQTTINNVKASISSDYPVMFGMNVYDSFYNTGSDGNVPLMSGKLEGGHGICLYAYDDNHVNGPGRPNGAFRGRNSWGASFADAGNFYLGYDIVLNIKDGFSDAWNLMVGTEFNPDPVPTPTPTPTPTVPPVDSIYLAFKQVVIGSRVVEIAGTASYKGSPQSAAPLSVTVNDPQMKPAAVTTKSDGSYDMKLTFNRGKHKITIQPVNGNAIVITPDIWF